MKAALGSLRSRKLLTFQQRVSGSRAEWVPTTMGRAVFESSMPTSQGAALYHSLARLHTSEAVIEDSAQLIFLIIQVALPALRSETQSCAFAQLFIWAWAPILRCTQ